jgi:thiol-disulfide isomerase/thioredoxin
MILNSLKLGGLLAIAVFFTTNLPEGMAQTHIVTDKSQLAKLKAAVEAKPEDFETHWAYIRARDFESPELISQYEEWVKKYPRLAAVPYSIGEALSRKVNPKAKLFLLKALAIDPNLAAAWNALARDAERWGDFEGWRNYLGKAVETAPKNADYAFYYTDAFSSVNMEKYTTMSLEYIANFPESERAAQALYWLAHRTGDVSEKIKYYEWLHKSFPANKYNWSASGMNDYFNLLLSSDPEKAIDLAEEMKGNKEMEKDWSLLVAVGRSFKDAKKLMDDKKGMEALTVLNQIKLPRRSSLKLELLLWKAQANSLAGNTSVAYESLVEAFIKAPSPRLKKQIVVYGKEIGKNEQQIGVEIWKKLDAVAKPATPFNLKNYLTSGNTSLEDYKGKVVLITYWYPGCGPCRGEFPHFENAIKKFKGKDFAYLGINIYSKQNDFVIPFVKGSGYSFIPLEDVKGRVKGNLDNREMAPMNFLIDKQGRVIFSEFTTDGNNEDELELMIKMLITDQKV